MNMHHNSADISTNSNKGLSRCVNYKHVFKLIRGWQVSRSGCTMSDSKKKRRKKNGWIWCLSWTKVVDTRPFNLHPEKWFDGYPVKSTQICIGYHLRFFRIASNQIFFEVLTWFFFWFWHPNFSSYHSEKNLGSYPKKNSGGKNMGRLYRVPLKSLLKV